MKTNYLNSFFCKNRKSIVVAGLILVNIFSQGILIANTAHTGMRNITSMELVADMGAGLNLSNTLDAHGNGVTGLATETYWGNPVTTKAMIDAIKNKGFKTLRIPTTWYPHLGPAPTYTIDPAWLDRVEEVANYAFANDMYVIINIHHDDSWIVPTYAKLDEARDQLKKVWTQIANRFKTYGDYLIFETLNEPRLVGAPEEWNGGTAEARDVINKFHLAAVNAIRATGGNNASRFLMVAPYCADGSDVTINALVIPNNDPKVIISWHNYSPFSFCLENPGTTTWGTATDKANLDATFDRMYNKFIAQGRAVIIGEWSPSDKNNTTQRAGYADYFVKAAKSKKMAPIFWDGSIFNRNTITWVYPTIANAIVAPFNTSSSVVSGATYKITARHSGKVLDVAGYSLDNGANIDQWPGTGGANQQFVLTDVGSGYFKVVAVHSGKALDVNAASTADGANVQQWTYSGGTNQQWQFVSKGDGYYQIKVRNSGKCLDVNASSLSDGANVQIWTCGSGYNQQFFLEKINTVQKSALVNNQTEKTEIKIYPNPVTDRLNLNLSGILSQIDIFDLHGKKMLHIDANQSQQEIDVSKLSAGIYILELILDGKKQIYKIVKTNQ